MKAVSILIDASGLCSPQQYSMRKMIGMTYLLVGENGEEGY
ncbi:hypothetical protein [Desulfitobacterium hafniense]|nr:hypothetical protein [Desulfitobacterium hafniense]